MENQFKSYPISAYAINQSVKKKKNYKKGLINPLESSPWGSLSWSSIEPVGVATNTAQWRLAGTSPAPPLYLSLYSLILGVAHTGDASAPHSRSRRVAGNEETALLPTGPAPPARRDDPHICEDTIYLHT